MSSAFGLAQDVVGFFGDIGGGRSPARDICPGVGGGLKSELGCEQDEGFVEAFSESRKGDVAGDVSFAVASASGLGFDRKGRRSARWRVLGVLSQRDFAGTDGFICMMARL